ncbi:MAG: hypothetical protein CR968_02025 [Flavobacteriia bacterium]|nr:MAG: hypothetical protein CR968_02025 [Flavobacteriia bacterium]
MEKTDAKYLRRYFILAYIIFWLLIAFTGFLIFLEVPSLVQSIMKNVCAWTPFFVIIIMFKKLYPNLNFKEYFKLQFTKKIGAGLFVSSLLLQVFIASISVLVFFLINNKSLDTMTLIGVSFIGPVLITDLTGGAVGEELGWRGYALNTLQKKYTPFVASLILGVLWGFWHLPLMLLSGYSGIELVYYIMAFMLAIISFSLIITFFFNKCQNILIAMWMHFWFNFLMKIVVIKPLDLLTYVAFGYLISAAVIVLFNRNEMLKKREWKPEQ